MQFTDQNLANYNVVIFLLTSGNVLNEAQRAAFRRYIQAGGGFVGIHSAVYTEFDSPWYAQLVGAVFESHPDIQEATVEVVDPDHPSTASLPKLWMRTDEWYNFKTNPRSKVHVLALLDETTYKGGTMELDHPIAWCHDFDGGRAWYTAMGHTEESYIEPLFLDHILGGIRTAAGVEDADCGTEN
jgi:type 1 glutamine amidotransferase